MKLINKLIDPIMFPLMKAFYGTKAFLQGFLKGYRDTWK